MAHRSNIIQVMDHLEPAKRQERVKDPVCKKEMGRAESKYTIYQGDRAYYFCSKDCGKKFMTMRPSEGQVYH